MDLIQASARHLVQDSLPMANDAERDAAARSVVKAAEAALVILLLASLPVAS